MSCCSASLASSAALSVSTFWSAFAALAWSFSWSAFSAARVFRTFWTSVARSASSWLRAFTYSMRADRSAMDVAPSRNSRPDPGPVM